ncbi:hypothetical protein KM043_004358 [Ampulex compressa]|nr:hypothetical protein KM043_004358 [Ampulex compressa]
MEGKKKGKKDSLVGGEARKKSWDFSVRMADKEKREPLSIRGQRGWLGGGGDFEFSNHATLRARKKKLLGLPEPWDLRVPEGRGLREPSDSPGRVYAKRGQSRLDAVNGLLRDRPAASAAPAASGSESLVAAPREAEVEAVPSVRCAFGN